MIRLKNIDYTKYSPVQLRESNSCFVYTVEKHLLFDEADDKDIFFCHPLTQYGEADFKRTVVLPKSSIMSIPIRL